MPSDCVADADGASTLLVADGDTLPAAIKMPELFLDRVKRQAEADPDRKLYTWLDEYGKEADSLSYGQLWSRAGAVAHLLLTKYKLQRGDRVSLAPPDT